MRYGPASDERYQRLNPGAVARRRALAGLTIAALRDYCEELLWDEFKAGRLPHTRAIPTLSNVMAQSLKHGAFAVGIAALADLSGVSARTIIRGSKQVRERRVSGRHGASGFLWRKRGRKGEGVTIWRPAHALVDSITAVRAKRRRYREAAVQRAADHAELQAAIRNVLGTKGSRSQCDTVAHVAAPGRPEGGGGEGTGRTARASSAPATQKMTTKPDIPDLTSMCEHGRHVRACLACARTLVGAGA